MRQITNFLLVMVLTLIGLVVLGQPQSLTYPSNCPSYPTINYFDEDCYMYLDEIQLGMGRVHAPDGGISAFWGGAPREVYIPCNRPDWAIASLHGWQLMRNVLGQDYYDKHVFLATGLQESFWKCDPNMDWSCYENDPVNYPSFDPALAFNGTNGEYNGGFDAEGCFHLSAPGYKWLEVYMPHRHDPTTYSTYAQGNNFVRGVISKTHYDLLGLRFYQEGRVGADPLDMFANATDEFAADVWNALHYNRGYGSGELADALSSANRAASLAQPDWVYVTPSFTYS